MENKLERVLKQAGNIARAAVLVGLTYFASGCHNPIIHKRVYQESREPKYSQYNQHAPSDQFFEKLALILGTEIQKNRNKTDDGSLQKPKELPKTYQEEQEVKDNSPIPEIGGQDGPELE